MRVPEDMRDTVAFLGRGVRVNDEVELDLRGTCFIVEVPLKSVPGKVVAYLVTARHVAEALSGSEFYIRANKKGGQFILFTWKKETRWFFHPDPKNISDVAVLPFTPPAEMECRHISTDQFLDDEKIAKHQIGAGDEVIITGLFTKMEGRSRNIPIVRIGNLAMMPGETIPDVKLGPGLIGDMEAYLVEARSIGGLSGSPAWVRQSIVMDGLKSVDGDAVFLTGVGKSFFLGLMHGHWEIASANKNDVRISALQRTDDTVNLGIAVVVPAKCILEVLNQPELIALRDKAEQDAVVEAQRGP